MKTRSVLATVGLLLAASLAFAQAPTVTLSVNPATGVGSVTPTITWSTTQAQSCQASGGWSGAKPTSGTETLPAVTVNTTYTLTCTGPVLAANGTAALSWTAPTQNTDGTPLTNLAGFRVQYGTSQTALDQSVSVTNAATTARTITALPAGTWYFGVRAVTTQGVESNLSAIVSKTIVAPAPLTASASTAVDVSNVPNPPTGLQVIEATAYDLRLDCSNIFSCFRAYLRDDYRLNVVVGQATLGAGCGPVGVDVKEAGYFRVPTQAVALTRTPKSRQIVARCA